MTTPVLFLDDASCHVGSLDRVRAEQTVMVLLATLKRLRKINKKFALNTARPIAQYQIADDWTLQAVLGGASFTEEWLFIRALSDRSPFAAGLEEGLLLEVGDMDFRTRSGQIPSRALAWATLLDSATVSFDAHADWAQAWVDTAYALLEEDGSVSEVEGRVRNASQVAHVGEHVEWLRLLGFSPTPTAERVWNEKADRFAGLRFLPRVAKDLIALEGSGVPFRQALSALEALTQDAANWDPRNPWPDFSTKATPESGRRQKFCWTIDDATGKKELFDWHTRFTGCVAGRVHFRVDSVSHSIVVAYIGGKLMRRISS